MAKQEINLGSAPNAGDGDPLRTAFNKINENFDELYNTSGGLDLLNVASNVIPATDNTYDLGSPAKRWKHGYFATGSLYVGDLKLSNDGGTLLVQQVTNAGLITEAPIPDTPGVVTTDRIVNGANTFSITAAGELELNGDPFTGGGGSGTSLINGSNQVVLEADGSLTFPTKTFKNWNDIDEIGPTLQLGNDPASQVLITGPTPNNTYWDAQRLVIQGQQGYGGENNDKGEGGDVYIWAGSGGDPGSLQPRGDGGDVKLRGGLGGNNGGYIRIESGDAQADSGTGGFLDLNAGNAGATSGTGGNVNINAGGGNSVGGNVNIDAGQGDNLFGGSVNISAGYGPTEIGSVNIETGTGNWSFKPDNSFSISGNEVHIATNNWGIGVGGGVGATGVVYTAKQYQLSSIRVHATIEGLEDGDASGNHTQACDMMIIRRVTDAGVVTVDSVVYGVIYSGTGPLASLDAQWNPGTGDPTTGRIEITATPTSTTNNVYVKIYATEVSRGD
jgi:hypothetical protein